MGADTVALHIVHPRIIWGHETLGGEQRQLCDADLSCELPKDGFRWIHLSLSDMPSRRWIESCPLAPPLIRELLLSGDERQRAVVEDGVLGFVLQDVERDFDESVTRVGLVRFAVSEHLVLTARSHPVHSADIAKERIALAGPSPDAASALELLFGAMAEASHRTVIDLDSAVQAVEDHLLKDAAPRDGRDLVRLRLLMVRMHRLLHGNRTVLRDLVDAGAATPALAPVIVRAAERLSHMDSDLVAIQAQLRLLREEIDLQAGQRTNQNLYILSIVSALVLPATLVTGVFGMNTGGLPWTMDRNGTLWGLLIAAGLSAAVYILLRTRGFFRN